MTSFSIDPLMRVASPLINPPLSPLLLLAIAVADKRVRQAASGVNEVYYASALYPVLRRVLAAARRALTANVWLTLFTTVAAVKVLNRLGARLLIDRAAPRKIVWKDHVVVVSGAARGIGGTFCQLLAAKGAKVVALDLADRSEHGAETLYIKADVTSQESLRSAKERVHKELGPVSFVVACAGITTHGFILDDPESYDIEPSVKVLDVNASGLYRFVRTFGADLLPVGGLRQNGAPRNGFGGHILIIGSGAAFTTLPANATYNMSKAAAVSMHHCLTQELSYYHQTNNVRNSVICPLRVESDMTRGKMQLAKSQFLLPDLRVHQVAAEMVRMLERDRSVVRFLPELGYGLSFLPINLPPWMFTLFVNNTGHGETFVDYCRKQRGER